MQQPGSVQGGTDPICVAVRFLRIRGGGSTAMSATDARSRISSMGPGRQWRGSADALSRRNPDDEAAAASCCSTWFLTLGILALVVLLADTPPAGQRRPGSKLRAEAAQIAATFRKAAGRGCPPAEPDRCGL